MRSPHEAAIFTGELHSRDGMSAKLTVQPPVPDRIIEKLLDRPSGFFLSAVDTGDGTEFKVAPYLATTILAEQRDMLMLSINALAAEQQRRFIALEV